MSASEGAAQQGGPQQGRPYMPGYGVTTDEDGLLPWEWVEAQMARSRNYWISSTRPDGRPHAVPVWGVWVEGTLYFGSGRQARKARNFAQNPAVVAHVESGDDVVILEGVVEEVSDMALLTRIAQAYAAKYPGYEPDPDPGPGGVIYAVRPQAVFAWQERDFLRTPTRWQFGEG